MDSQPPKAAPYDPGWNDPPPLTFASQISAPSKPRTILNKRVAFPVQPGAVPQVKEHPPQPMPIYTPDSSSLPPKNDLEPSKIVNFSNAENLSSSEMCTAVMNTFSNLLNDSGELGSKIKDIQKRIDVMQNQWEKEQLSREIQVKVYELSEALKNRNISQANTIHQCLVVDHIASVSSWIPAIRQMIHHMQVKEELLSIDSQEDGVS